MGVIEGGWRELKLHECISEYLQYMQNFYNSISKNLTKNWSRLQLSISSTKLSKEV